MNVLIFARGAEKSQKAMEQITKCGDYAKENNWTVARVVYLEGQNGLGADYLSVFENGLLDIDIVLVHDHSRISRNPRLIFDFETRLREQNIKLVSVSHTG